MITNILFSIIFYLNIFIGGADALLYRAEGLRVAHLTEFAWHSGRDPAKDRSSLLSSRSYHRFSFLVSGQRKTCFSIWVRGRWIKLWVTIQLLYFGGSEGYSLSRRRNFACVVTTTPLLRDCHVVVQCKSKCGNLKNSFRRICQLYIYYVQNCHG